MAFGVIYLLIDGTNDLEYVGQTKRSAELRFREHKYEKSYIGSAIRAHGAGNFVIAILKECANQQELDYWEKYFIKWRDTKSPNGYNLTEGGDGCLGLSHTVEGRTKMSAARTGDKNHFFGKHHTLETCAKLSMIHTGKKMSAEACAKMSATRTGRKRSAETCAKIATALTGKKFPDDRCFNIAEAKRGKTPYKNLLAEMIKRRLSYKGLTDILDWSVGTVSKKMRGICNFTLKEIAQLVEFFVLPAEYLLARDDGLPAVISAAELGARISAANRHESPYKNLLAETNKRQLSYSGLAKILGWHPGTFSTKMLAKQNFTENQVAHLVEFFGLPAEYLLARDDGLSAVTSQAERSRKISLARRCESPYKNLLAEMDKRQISYSELAELLGTTQPTVSHKLRGRYNFTERDKAKLVEIFGLPAEYLLAI
ncbi:MAG: GIY-YIG nuclease family protein [Selenomonadaceae bacterium]|nr:GIY-YIG nuclease family protein [Selenomonadaceae bacterium]